MTRAVAHHGASRSFTGAVTATCPEVAARLRTAASSSSPSLDLTRIAPALSARMVSGAPELSKVARVRFWIGRAGSRATISPVESASSASPPTRPGLAASTARKVSATGVEGSDASAASRRRANSPARMSISSAAASKGAHPLRIQVLARQVRQEDEEETRGDGPRDAGPRPREAPKDK